MSIDYVIDERPARRWVEATPPTFPTPGPITVDVEPGIGDVTVVAGDRVDTVVEVRPTNPEDASDVDAAVRTTVECAGGTLTIRGPRLDPLDSSDDTRSIDVTVALPAGSEVRGKSGVGDLTATGRLGDVGYWTGLGHVRVEAAAALSVTSATGDIVVGAAGGAVRARSANGDITVGEAAGDVEATTPNGTIRVLDAGRGSLWLATALGGVEVGIHEGSAAWLDVETRFGVVRNELTASDPPVAPVDTVEVHATTAIGDVVVHRARGRSPR
ncbi:MAG TPA: hypothetical protein VKB57_19490 [Acidimicrobiales bacterium]|nr:hypothetical protein [Acidimicrobiales bacterium]